MERRRAHLPPPPQWEDEPQPDDTDGGWLIIYLDVMTLMLCLFVVLLAYSSYSTEEYKALTKTLSNPVAVQGPVEAPIEPRLQRQEQEASIDKPTDVEAKQLQERFRSALLSQGLQESIEVTVSANQVNLQISERILFELGQAELTGEGRDVLVRLVPMLTAASDYTLSIEGHTDPTPIANAQFPSNWELSAQRATGVLRFLLTQGVAASRMRAVGHADTRPLADNATAEGRARNRRVALILQRAEE
ncbi:OmpA family protein [Sedimenticola sp.]|uniref:OmpA/MotB family protein n=2 Tax=Sedimenticola sp. TaxID=1940285 RepID=UPI003D0F8CC3